MKNRFIGTVVPAIQLRRALIVRLPALLAAAFLLGGCPRIQLVADYDEKTYEETIRIGKSVDAFYAKLLDARNEERSYDRYGEKYTDIEADIRSLVRRNAARQLNVESRKISETILDLWEKYRCHHKNRHRPRPLKGDEICDRLDECATLKDAALQACIDRKGYPRAQADRDRLARLFTHAAAAELAKGAADKDLTDSDTDSF